jgi:GAF domain-containing protein
MAGYTPRSILAAPVGTSERLLGVLEVLDRSEDRPEAAADLELLAVVADQAALALEGARAFDDFGRRLLAAGASAAEQDGQPDLAQVLRTTAAELAPPEADLLELAALVGELGRLDVEQRRLATRVVREFVIAAQERHDRRPVHTPRR